MLLNKGLWNIYLLFLSAGCLSAQYRPDILGEDYLSRAIQMPDDYDGEVVCTLIKKPNRPENKQAVLYIHGYNDYFFQQELGDSIYARGYNFYAIDLRKYGRSILPHQDPFFCKSLTEYFADIDTALAIIREEGNEDIFIMAHSTGGLISPLYVNNRQANIRGLILNSPFLDMNMNWFLEEIGIPVIAFLGRFFPNWVIQGEGISSYAHSLLKQYRGEWAFDTHLKKENEHPKKAGWIRAIHQGHTIVQKGLDLPCPVLVLSSDKSETEKKTWNEAYRTADIVLDVDDIRTYGARLGHQTTYHAIPDAKHDLILSIRPARDYTYQVIFNWLKEK